MEEILYELNYRLVDEKKKSHYLIKNNVYKLYIFKTLHNKRDYLLCNEKEEGMLYLTIDEIKRNALIGYRLNGWELK